MQTMEHCLQVHDYTEFNIANRAFNFTIYAANHNGYLMNMITGM